MSVFDRRYELMARAELEQLQLERLQALVVRLKRNVRRYRESLAEARVNALEDLAGLPMTTPEDMADSFPFGMFALPMREVIRLHSTVGPEGRPLVIGHTRNDVGQWARLVARQLVASGVTAHDVVQVSLGSGAYRGGAGYALGTELIEASVIAEEPFHIDHQLAMLQHYRPTMLITTPTNARELARVMAQQKIDPPSLQLRTVLLTRPIAQATRDELEAGLLVSVQCSFGVSEMLDPGLCVQCEEGLFHVNEDHFLVEVQERELVVTTLCREAMPLLRYRTRVGCDIRQVKCPCGRTGRILEPGERLDGRLRVREMPLYKSQINVVLEQTPVSGRPFSVEVCEGHILVLIEMTEGLFSDMIWPIENMQRQIESEFMSRLGIQAEVRFCTHPQEGVG